HTYDIARQGYVNLLPVQHKRSKNPGDSKAMVFARTQFLNSGVYQPIAARLAELVLTQLNPGGDYCLLDAGCGEGYYLDAVFDSLKHYDDFDKLSFIGVDISRDAIIQSSKRNKQIGWLVGTNRQLPVMNESVDIILCLFGFSSADGFNKALKPGGKVIVVDPGPEHLKELREIIYKEVKKGDLKDFLKPVMPGFSLLSSEKLQFKEKITNNKQINNLLVMTPHFYRASKAGREVACNLSELDITVDVVFRVLQKRQVETGSS
ncbi:MAG: methyltransferase domain-containing protein, partial [Gammaproteobacteria bacterium]|nr:methyltransferase domain-containing protein [Gammaproteobacteria bacterium]